MVESKGKDWRELCAEAAEEPDSEKVVTLVNQILEAFDEDDQKLPKGVWPVSLVKRY